jgi:oligopeptide/dipeptide ABC transporter ATP-binding protein
MSVGAQIEEVLTIHGGPSRQQRRARVIELLTSVGVPDPAVRARSLPYQLSGGLRQRVMVAIALAGAPDLVIADEPTTALDVTVQAQVLALLREVTRSSVVLFITHDMGVVAEIADRVVVMYAGAVVESGVVEDILERPHHPYTAALLASVPDPDRPATGELPTIPGRVPPLGERGTGCPFRDRCPRQTDQCAQMPALAPLTAGGSDVACWHPEHAGPIPDGPSTGSTATDEAMTP